MEEELAQRFYEKLVNKEGNPGVILTQFYCTFYGFEFNQKLIPLFGKLIRLYGRNLVYMALLDLFNVETVDHEHIFGFINYLTKKRFEDKYMVTDIEDLTARFTQLSIEINKARKLKVSSTKDPFDAK